MLPPRRMTRSARAGSQPVHDAASGVGQALSLDVFATASAILPKKEAPQTQLLFSTPQFAYVEQDVAAEGAQKKARRKLTVQQRLALENLASQGNNPSLEARRALAAELGL